MTFPKCPNLPRVLVVAPLLALVACEPSQLPPDAEALASRYADARVTFEERCVLPHSLLGRFASEAEPTLAGRARRVGRAELAADFMLPLGDDRFALDRDAFARCVSIINASEACPTDPPALLERAGCNEVFVGGRALAEGCADNSSCAPGLFCDAEEGQCGRCAQELLVPVVADDPCEDSPLCGLEEAPNTPGSACTTACGALPYPSLLCVEGTCVERTVADLGEPCDAWSPPVYPTLVHCRESDSGSTVCADLDIADDAPALCVAVSPELPGALRFVPGAAVVSAVDGPFWVADPALECGR